MKRLFTLAIIAMIASLTFAQAPVQKVKASDRKIEKVATPAQMQKAMDAKAAIEAKAKAAQETSGSVLRHAAKKVAGTKMGAVSDIKSNTTYSVKNRSINAPKAKTAPRKGAPTVDANGIITAAPADGEARVYARSQAFYAYVNSSNQVSYAYQSGNVNVVVDGDDWYIKDIICQMGVGTWVKGHLNEDGTKLVVPAGQMIYWSADGGYGMTINYGEGAGTWAKSNADITYTVSGNTLTLDNAHAYVEDGYINFEDNVLGAFWTDDDSWAGYGEWSTVLTYDPGYVAPVAELVEVPAGLATEDWYLNGQDSDGAKLKNKAATVGFDGADVYVKGISQNYPDSWVKGTVDGATITFAKNQYIGNYSGVYDIWFVGSNASGMADAVAAYDATAKTITFANTYYDNAATDRIYYLESYSDVVLSAEPVVETVITDLTAEMPYSNSFDTEEEVAQAAIYDANSDGKTWKLNGTEMRYTYSSSNNGDDYIVFPGLALSRSKTYKVSFDTKAYSTNYPERIELVAGTEAVQSELTTSVIAPTVVDFKEYQTLSANFKPSADGTYYFAIHGISDADAFYLFADNFKVSELDTQAPGAPTSVSATPAAEGAMGATIEFKTPSKTVGGTSITTTQTIGYKVTRGEVVVAEGTARRSTAITVEDTNEDGGLVNGMNTWTITLSRTISGAEHVAEPVQVSCWVGEDDPTDATDLTASDKNDHVALAWNAPTEGVNGGYINVDNLKYNAYPVEMVDFFGMQFPSIDYDNPYATGISGTSYDIVMDTNQGEQDYVYFGVTVGEGDNETDGVMAAEVLGAPYELPFHESLTGQALHYWWGYASDDDNYDADGGLYFSTTDSSDGDDVSFYFDAETAGWIDMYSGKVALDGAENPGLSFDYKGTGSLKVTVYGPTMEETETITPGENYATFVKNLASFKSEPWVRFTIRGEYTEAGETYVDNVNIMDLVQNDLAVSVAAPTSVVAGNTAVVKATVQNVGLAAAEGYDVKFYVNGEEAATPAFETPALAFLETADFELELETSIFDEAGDIVVKAEVVFAADEKDANNTDEVVVEVTAPTATPVASVTAENSSNGVVVSWTVAENSAEEVTEDFESYAEMAIVTNGETLGPWTGWDVDGGKMYGWNSGNWPYSGTSAAFGIYNQDAIFDGQLGNGGYNESAQALMFMSVSPSTSTTGKNDDWFVSPELPGIAQTISFMISELSDEYGNEKYEVLASSTGNTPDCFTSVVAGEASMDWTEVSANLPEGTKFFAIRCLSNDAFVMLVDDLKYTVGGASPVGFNIYIDQAQVASVDAEATSYTYTGEISEGNHEFSVTAVYGAGESAPVTATLGVTTGIQNIDAATAVEVYTIDGIRLNNVKNLKPGVYVVNGKKLVIK